MVSLASGCEIGGEAQLCGQRKCLENGCALVLPSRFWGANCFFPPFFSPWLIIATRHWLIVCFRVCEEMQPFFAAIAPFERLKLWYLWNRITTARLIFFRVSGASLAPLVNLIRMQTWVQGSLFVELTIISSVVSVFNFHWVSLAVPMPHNWVSLAQDAVEVVSPGVPRRESERSQIYLQWIYSSHSVCPVKRRKLNCVLSLWASEESLFK